jgi:lipopolysaccharide biosynthesis glycosyltransferase
MEPVVVVGVCDHKFMIPYTVCFASILEHTTSPIDFYLICSDVTPQQKQDMIDCLNKISSGAKVTFISLSDQYTQLCFGELKHITTHCTNSTFMKISIIDTLSDKDKIIYVDGDFCFNSDISI